MTPRWQTLCVTPEAAVLQQLPPHELLQKLVNSLASEFKTDCLLWSGEERSFSRSFWVYGTPRAIAELDTVLNLAAGPRVSQAKPGQEEDLQTVSQQRELSMPPAWLSRCLEHPQPVQLKTGGLLLPLVLGEHWLVLQLGATTPPWSTQTIEVLEVCGRQSLLALQLLICQTQLAQVRQQASLVGRITHLLNGGLHPDAVVGRIVAELGQGLGWDGALLVDLRQAQVNILAVWDGAGPGTHSPALNNPPERSAWLTVVETFLASAASHLEIVVGQEDPDPLTSWWQEMAASTVLLVPLFVQEDFFGVVVLVSRQPSYVVTLEALQTVRQVADQVAIALTQAQSYQSTVGKFASLQSQSLLPQFNPLQDRLTQLPNRHALERQLEQLTSAACWTVQAPFSLILCDIDYFKLVNDSYSYLTGDEVLASVADRLQAQVRQGTPVYRYGGEEFAILLVGVALEPALEVAKRLRTAIREAPFVTGAGKLEITASFGVAEQDKNHDRDAWSVLQRADQALYQAKHQGRDRVIGLQAEGSLTT